MNAAEWKAKGLAAALAAAVELELPSGAVVKARRPAPEELAVMGLLPMGLVGEASGGADTPEVDTSRAAAMVDAMRNLLVWAVLEPRISMAPGPGEIHPRDIAGEDWRFILRWAMRSPEVEGLRRFRGRGADAGDCGDGEDFRSVAQHLAAGGRSGSSAGVGHGGGGSDRTDADGGDGPDEDGSVTNLYL